MGDYDMEILKKETYEIVLPKYKVGDKIFFIKDGKIAEGEVSAITITLTIKSDSAGQDARCFLSSDVFGFMDFVRYYTEDKIFATKEDLLRSLL